MAVKETGVALKNAQASFTICKIDILQILSETAFCWRMPGIIIIIIRNSSVYFYDQWYFLI